MVTDEPWPTELRVKDGGRALSVSFDNGSRFDLSAEYLRVESPSADVQGHSRAERKFVGGKADVTITAVVPVGNYAAKLVFDDGHDTGLYTWRYLRGLGTDRETIWSTYLEGLAAGGLKR